MEKGTIWSKTLLSAMRAAPSVNRHFDKLISSRTARVPGISECQSDYDCTYRQVEKILTYIEAKKRVFSILYIIDAIMSRVHINYRKALYLRYKLPQPPENIPQLLKCTIRTYFRHVKLGIAQFTQIRNALGYTDEYLEKNFDGDFWLHSLKNKTEEEHNTNLSRSAAGSKTVSNQKNLAAQDADSENSDLKDFDQDIQEFSEAA